jgi:2,4-dienoyl-CoA reductase-like NADH-dependent reductase (Old Yellow Enzyme family)
MSKLFTPFKLRGTEFKNRIFVSPMCQYSCVDGMPNNWHLVHLGSRAVGGAGLVMVEATGVTADGRISPADMGIWNDQQADALAIIANFIAEQGAVPAIQLAHAGRKASTAVPWQGNSAVKPEQGGWQVVAPSAIAFSDTYPMPRALAEKELAGVVSSFVEAAKRALKVICYTNSCRPSAISAPMPTAAAWKIALVCRCKWHEKCEKYGLKICRCLCVSLLQTG